MNLVDRLRTSADERVLSGRRAVVIVWWAACGGWLFFIDPLFLVNSHLDHYVCVYMCMCVYVRTCIYVYICMCVCVGTSMRLYTCVCVCLCIFVHIFWCQYQCFSVWMESCMRMCFRVHKYAYTYVLGIYICAFFCGECCMRFTGVLGTGAWAGVYITQVCFYTNVHICEHTRCRLCTYLYMYICVYMHAYAYVCVCASMILLDTLRRCC